MKAFTMAMMATVLFAVAVPAGATAAKPNKQADKAAKRLTDAVTVSGIMRHERALMNIAERNGGTRASGTRGFDKSRDYVVGQLQNAGYTVNVQPFEFPFFQELAPSTFERTAPTARTYDDSDFATMDFSGSGDATGTVVPVDVVLPPGAEPSSNTSGCEAADFDGFPAGAIALVQRGTCTFGEKATNAENAGAAAVLIFNEGQPGRTEALSGTLGGPVGIPVLGTSFAVGDELAGLAAAGGTTVHVTTSTLSETRTTYNVIADAPSGRAGSHRRRRLAPGLRHRRARDQRRRVGHVPGPRDRAALRQGGQEPDEPRAVHLLRCRRGRAARLGALRVDAVSGRQRPDHGDARLRHDGLAELREVRLRR